MKNIFFSIGLVLIIFFGVVGGGRILEKSPKFCASCHEMKDSYNSWISSGASEKHTNCIQCHSGQGLTGIIGAEMRGLRQIYQHITGRMKGIENISNVVPDRFCLKCHDIKEMQHEHHEEHNIDTIGKKCAVCHNHKKDNNFFEDMD
ncbi:MAG: NapC/NirT family cytochrome c [Nitrospirota bacterium]